MTILRVPTRPSTCPECGKAAVCTPTLHANGAEWRLAIFPTVIACFGLAVAVIFPLEGGLLTLGAVTATVVGGSLLAARRFHNRLSGSERRAAVVFKFVLFAFITNFAIAVAASMLAVVVNDVLTRAKLL